MGQKRSLAKTLGPKNLWVQKRSLFLLNFFELQKSRVKNLDNFGAQKYCRLNRKLYSKKFWSKNVWVQKDLGQKNVGQKKCWSEKIFSSKKKIGTKKIFG